MKLCRVITLKNKLSLLICFSIILSIFYLPVYARVMPISETLDRDSEQIASRQRIEERLDPDIIEERRIERIERQQKIIASLTQLELGEDFLFNVDQNAAQRYFEVFDQFDAAISQNSFNFEQALQIANSNGMTASGSIDTSINQGSADVTNATNQIQALFRSNLGCNLAANATSTISKVIEDTFNTHISSSNYIVYSSKSGGENSYLFKVLAGSVLLAGNQATLTLVPLEINVHVKVKKEKILFITINNSKHYDVSVKAQAYKKTITF